ncbi:MAG TPA: PH domain-containing protein [Candidatus Saccharibacteria bacterium]|nr:PH domain-containing protein [Candidatus Saccharibacteria bacterium]
MSMKQRDESVEDLSRPVAYDAYGRPLYAHPPAEQVSESASPAEVTEPQVVYLSRAVDPHKQEISETAQKKHTESQRKYPFLNLSEGEYVISAIRRHPIGLISIWGLVALAIIIILSLPAFMAWLDLSFILLSSSTIMSGTLIVLLSIALAVLAGVAATMIYDANRFFLTNESVIQHIQSGLFSKKDQTISLNNIEDASYRQHGILQTLFNYGSIRLSTEGEETTYRFYFVANPEEQIRLLNNAVEAFKNFRPIADDD